MNSPVEGLQNPDRNVRASAILELGTQCDLGTVGALIAALRTERELFVREYIVWALVRMSEAALTPLIELLADDNAMARQSAAHTLGKIRDPRALEALMVSLRDPDVTVVSKAAVALASIGDAKAIPSLTSLLGREAPEFRSSLTAVLEKFGEQAVGALVVALKHSDWRVREQAAEILGLIGRETAVLPLIDILGDDCWQVRFAAVYALGHIGGADARAAVQTLHTDTDRRVRELVPRLLDRSRRHVSRAGTSRAGTPAPRV